MNQPTDPSGGARRSAGPVASRRRLPRPLRSFIGLAAGFVLATVAIAAVGAAGDRLQVRDPVHLGHLDLARYCRQERGDQMMATLLIDDADGWRCVGRRGGLWLVEEIDLGAACRALHGDTARFVNEVPGSAHHLVCVRDV